MFAGRQQSYGFRKVTSYCINGHKSQNTGLLQRHPILQHQHIRTPAPNLGYNPSYCTDIRPDLLGSFYFTLLLYLPTLSSNTRTSFIKSLYFQFIRIGFSFYFIPTASTTYTSQPFRLNTFGNLARTGQNTTKTDSPYRPCQGKWWYSTPTYFSSNNTTPTLTRTHCTSHTAYLECNYKR